MRADGRRARDLTSLAVVADGWVGGWGGGLQGNQSGALAVDRLSQSVVSRSPRPAAAAAAAAFDACARTTLRVVCTLGAGGIFCRDGKSLGG